MLPLSVIASLPIYEKITKKQELSSEDKDFLNREQDNIMLLDMVKIKYKPAALNTFNSTIVSTIARHLGWKKLEKSVLEERIKIKTEDMLDVNSLLTYYGKARNKKELAAFNKETNGKPKLLFVIDKLNEGAHLKGVKGIVWLRQLSVDSRILFYQQLGRCIHSYPDGHIFTEEERPIVMDLVNNINTVNLKRNQSPINDLEDLKIIIIKNPKFLTKGLDSPKSDVKNFIKYLKKPIDSTILIIDATNCVIHQTNEIYKTLRNVARIIDYPEPEEIEIKGWIVRSFDSNNIDIKDDALNLLMEYIGDDQSRLSQEINKLTSYIGRGGTIYKKDIKLLVPKNVNNEIYHLIKAIINHDLNETYQIYNNLSNNTKDPLMIISLISNKFKELLSTYRLLKFGYSQSDIAKFYNISNGKAYYLVQEAKSFNLSDLEYYIDKLSELDYQIKSGKLDKTIGLELLLLKLPTQ